MPQSYKKTSGKPFPQFPENHPVVSLIYLMMLMFIGTIVFGLISILLIILMGNGIEGLPEILSGQSPDLIPIRIIQTFSSIGTFIVPAWILSKIESKRTRYFSFYRPSSSLLWLSGILIILVAAPILELSGAINQQLQLPDFLSGVEDWMIKKEADLKLLTEAMLKGGAYTDLFFNLFMIALLPAIGEELIFRGMLQNIMARWTKNAHLGIWIAAIIFSSIHMQFYGFLPRLLMGALFGYLLFWSKSLWFPIIAHFINNAIVVIYAFILQKQGASLHALDEPMALHFIWYLLSFGACMAILYYFWKYSTYQNIHHGRPLD